MIAYTELEVVSEKKLYILVGDITKKIQMIRSQSLLYWKGCKIGYQKHFKWFDLMVRFKCYAYFYEGRWKQPGPVSHSARIQLSNFTRTCPRLSWSELKEKGTVQGHSMFLILIW